MDDTSLGKTRCSLNHLKLHGSDQENCPFSWARSPENLLQQETYLALATAFVLMRLLYKLFPALRKIAHLSWERSNLHVRIRSLWELPLLYMNRAIQLCNSLQEPCKRSNLQEGAMNAKAWASKSLASVSFGESSTSRVVPVSSTNWFIWWPISKIIMLFENYFSHRHCGWCYLIGAALCNVEHSKQSASISCNVD